MEALSNRERMAFHALAREVRKVNADNGWDPVSWDNVPVKVMMTVTELDEALQGIQGTGADPVNEELADAAIRILDMLQTLWGEEWSDRTMGLPQDPPHLVGAFTPGEVALWRPLRLLCHSVEAWRYDKRMDVRVGLELALRELFSLARQLGFCLALEVEWKVQKNQGRGHLHGKVRSAG
jgi:hypothetical protein